jgi:hypothetical protein
VFAAAAVAAMKAAGALSQLRGDADGGNGVSGGAGGGGSSGVYNGGCVSGGGVNGMGCAQQGLLHALLSGRQGMVSSPLSSSSSSSFPPSALSSSSSSSSSSLNGDLPVLPQLSYTAAAEGSMPSFSMM